MKTALLWLLITYGYNSSPIVVERFATVEECNRVAQVLKGDRSYPVARCVEATVVVTK